MGHLTIQGTEYEFPLVPEEGKSFAVSKNDLYYIKKAIGGDRQAREVILGLSDERRFFIGKESPRWLTISTDKEYVN